MQQCWLQYCVHTRTYILWLLYITVMVNYCGTTKWTYTFKNFVYGSSINFNIFPSVCSIHGSWGRVGTVGICFLHSRNCLIRKIQDHLEKRNEHFGMAGQRYLDPELNLYEDCRVLEYMIFCYCLVSIISPRQHVSGARGINDMGCNASGTTVR